MIPIILGLVILIIFTLIGTFIWAASDFPLAIREIAINTRREKHEGSSYLFLRVMSIVMKIFAVLLWVGGLTLSFLVVYTKFPSNLILK
jgi:hypothetical protein